MLDPICTRLCLAQGLQCSGGLPTPQSRVHSKLRREKKKKEDSRSQLAEEAHVAEPSSPHLETGSEAKSVGHGPSLES